MRLLFVILRIGLAVAVIAAVVGQLVTSLRYWNRLEVENVPILITNFFSFFTIESNVLSVVAMLIGAAFLLRDRADPTWFLVGRAAITTYMATTGIVYNLLLRGIELPQGSTLGWSNEILHVVAPLYLVIDWLFAPGRSRLEFRAIWAIVAFPILWCAYTLIRGPLTIDQVFGRESWYPYPFLDPNNSPEGYFSVAFYIALISLVIAAVGFGVVAISRRFEARSPALRV